MKEKKKRAQLVIAGIEGDYYYIFYRHEKGNNIINNLDEVYTFLEKYNY